jgi:branched-chain amino acid transport system substrate-binding protein
VSEIAGSTNMQGSDQQPVQAPDPAAGAPDMPVNHPGSAVTRRGFLRALGGTALATGTAALPAGCSRPEPPNLLLEQRIRIGFVSPQTGPLAAFAESDNFVVNDIRAVLKDGMAIDERRYGIDLLVKDSQSNAKRAAQVTSDLIDYDNVHLILTHAGGPETVNPVANVCEAREVPCLSTFTPWQIYVLGRDHRPTEPFEWTYHFFWGNDDVPKVFTQMWGKVETNKIVGALWPNDPSGIAAADPKTGYVPWIKREGYQIVDAGRYENQNNSPKPDFSKPLGKIIAAGPDILTGNPGASDFIDMWRQFHEHGFVPPYVTLGRALVFASTVEALKPSGDGLSTTVSWSPEFPYRSSLTGLTTRQFADRYTQQTGRQWTPTQGLVHALFEVALDVVRRAGGPGDRVAVVEAMHTTKLDMTMGGPLDWTADGRPHPNVAAIPLVGGQWRASRRFPFEVQIVSNEQAPYIRLTGDFTPVRP